MDLSSILMGLGLLVLFLGPILYLIFLQKKKQRIRTRTLNEISNNRNLSPDIVESTDMLVLGLDTKARTLIVVEPLRNNQAEVFELENFRFIRLRTTGASHKEEKYLKIICELVSKDKKTYEVVFYDDDQDLNLDSEAELIRAKKWQEIIGRYL